MFIGKYLLSGSVKQDKQGSWNLINAISGTKQSDLDLEILWKDGSNTYD